MTTIKTTIRNRRIDVPAPSEIPDGTEVILTVEASEVSEDQVMPPDEIARVLAAMQKLQPLDMPEDVAADLDAWERKINQRGVTHRDESAEDVFR
jgi:hypothetical protein